MLQTALNYYSGAHLVFNSLTVCSFSEIYVQYCLSLTELLFFAYQDFSCCSDPVAPDERLVCGWHLWRAFIALDVGAREVLNVKHVSL